MFSISVEFNVFSFRFGSIKSTVGLHKVPVRIPNPFCEIKNQVKKTFIYYNGSTFVT